MKGLPAFIRHLIDALVWGSILAILSRLPKPPSKSEVRKRRWIDRGLEAAALFGTLGAIGLLVMVSGIIPIGASTGHWPITRWFLEFSMERSFSTQSRGIEAPRLDDPALVLRGATQYETTCRPCHGAPDLHVPRVAAAMTPTPPYLAPEIAKWKPAELFSIVKHGVKFTGMPAWPALNRDDEVWAMVAFLQVLPRLDSAGYRRLAFGPIARSGGAAPIEDLTGPDNVPRTVRDRCARCHGVDGRGRDSAFPILSGQHAPYLYNALRAFAAAERHSGIMEPVAAGLTDAEMRELAMYFSRLRPAPETGTARAEVIARDAWRTRHAAAITRGREFASRGVPARKVPPCASCHGPTTPQPRREYPKLAGQHADYLVLQLELFSKRHRGGSRYAHLMHEVAPKLTLSEMRDVALYYESLQR